MEILAERRSAEKVFQNILGYAGVMVNTAAAEGNFQDLFGFVVTDQGKIPGLDCYSLHLRAPLLEVWLKRIL